MGKLRLVSTSYHSNINTILILAYTGRLVIDEDLPIRIGDVEYSNEVILWDWLFWYVLKPIEADLRCDDLSRVDVADYVSGVWCIRIANL